MIRAVIILILTLVCGGVAFAAEAQPIVGGKIAPVVLSDAHGQPIDMSRLLGTHPLLVVPVYFRCPNICGLGVNHLLSTLDATHLVPGRNVDVLIFSFDPAESRADATAFESRQRAEVPALASAPVHYLTGSSAAIAPLLTSLGITALADAKTGQFAHPAAAAVVAPDGRVTTWLSTLSITAGDLRSAVDTARSERSLSLRDFIVTCFHGAMNGAHDETVRTALRIAAGLTIVLILAAVTWLTRRREKQP